MTCEESLTLVTPASDLGCDPGSAGAAPATNPTRPANGRRALQGRGVITPPPPPTPPPFGPEYTKAWAKAPWLPARARAVLSKGIARRNDLDRAMAEARGLDPADPRCARFQGPHYHEALDRQVRKARAAP